MTLPRTVELDFPPGFPWARLQPFMDPLVEEDSERGRTFRREITRNDPLLFALVYCRDQVTVRRGDVDLVAMSEYHLDLISHARRWMLGVPMRDAWVAPRKSGKSTWPCLILPLWALAHKHRRFILMVSVNEHAVALHRERIYGQLDGNARLLGDFPDLLVRKMGSDRITIDGRMIMARSIKAQIQGAVAPNGSRPELIILDDIENDESNYSAAEVAKRLRTLRNAVLAMNETAVVELVGTTTMYGSIMHDVVRAAIGEKPAAWITESQFTPHYYPAILDEGGPRERSLWPGTWSLSWLKAERDRNPAYFAINYTNRPETAGGLHWTTDLFVEDPFFVSRRLVLTVDTAGSDDESADDYGISIIGSDEHPDLGMRKLCVEYAWKGHLTPTQLLEKIHFLHEVNPTLDTLVVETIGTGGKKWRDILSPLPSGLTLLMANPSKRGSKRTRLLWLLRQYERRAMVHRRYFSDLRGQMLSWPKTKDDLMDAVETGVAYHLLGAESIG